MVSMTLTTLFIVVFGLLTPVAIATSATPIVILVGAGMSGISAAKTLGVAGIKDILILEATDRIGGRIHKTNFEGVSIEMGANWVEGVDGKEMNPIWDMVNKKLKLKTFFSDYTNLPFNTYQQQGGHHKKPVAQAAFDVAKELSEFTSNLSISLTANKQEDISILTSQRLKQRVPSTPIEMAIDYYNYDYDYEYAEPPRVTSLQNTEPLPTFANFGEDVHFVADPRGYESVAMRVLFIMWLSSSLPPINLETLQIPD